MKLSKMLCFLAASGCLTAMADVKLPTIFSDNMVLQRDSKINVWGWADDGEKVTVSFKGQTVSTVAKNGEWQLALDPVGADSTGSEFTVTGKNKINLQNVLVGEVWICSGQSNMEWQTRNINNAAAELATANQPSIRLFYGNLYKGAATPQEDIPGKTWQVCSEQTVAKFSAIGFLFARGLTKELNVPVGVISVNWGGTSIDPWMAPCGYKMQKSLKGTYDKLVHNIPGTPEIAQAYARISADMEKWQADAAKALKLGKAMPELPQSFEVLRYSSHQQPCALYNTMIHPITRLAFRGALWYQGCANVHEGMLYRDKMHALVNSWRKVFNKPDMPFYFVQLAPFNYGNPYRLPLLWEAQQAFADEDSLSAMAVINDVGDFRDIHPRNKQDVSKRLLLLALKYTYGQKDLIADSPFFESLSADGEKITVTFRNASELKTKDGKPAKYFEIAGADGIYHPAQAELSGNKAILTSDKVSKPFMARYAWRHDVTTTLVNENDLPAGAFQKSLPLPIRENLDRLAPKAKNMEVAYAFSIKRPFEGGFPAYLQDNSEKLAGKKIVKIGYFMRLATAGSEKYVFATVDPFSQDINLLGLPTAAKRIFFQQIVKNLTVKSNVPGLDNGTFATGNVEMWPSNYAEINSANIPDASSRSFDFGDGNSSGNHDGYGSFQLHNFGKKQVVFALNNFRHQHPDVGIGNNPAGHLDYTFTNASNQYTAGEVIVLVQVQ